jgi:hypothetical protein
MARMRSLGLGLAAAFAIAALPSMASAESLPYYQSGGKPLGATTKIAFTTHGLKRSKWETGTVMECERDTGKGDLEGPKKIVKWKLEYKECETPAIHASCQKAPTKPGIIITYPLKGELVYASEKPGGPLIVANELQGETKPELAKFTCGPKKELSVTWEGVLLTPPQPINGSESLEAAFINAEKTKEEGSGCGKQQLLFIEAVGPCEHLFTAAGVMWVVSETAASFRAHKIAIVG